MANVRQAAIAAGFLHALRDDGVLAEWQQAKGDSKALCALIQKTLGLAETPSEADLAAMKDYAEEHLTAEHATMLEEQPEGPHVVGYGYGAQTQ